MNRPWLAAVMAVVLATGLMSSPAQVTVTAQAQDDPVARCAEGVGLFEAGQPTEAHRLLETGFDSRDGAEFANPDDLAWCALDLGLLRSETSDLTGALEAYLVAREIFHTSGSQNLEAMALNNIGVLYYDQARYDDALETLQQVLAIVREMGDRTGECAMLNNIGAVYASQGRYAEALKNYQQALAIAQEVGSRAIEGATLSGIGFIHAGQGRYTEAVDSYRQALAILRDVGDRAGEGTTLSGIGAAYSARGAMTRHWRLFSRRWPLPERWATGR